MVVQHLPIVPLDKAYLVAGAKFEVPESSGVRRLGRFPGSFASWWAVSPHRFDLFAKQMADQLTQVEASHRAVSGGQRRLILFHPASAKLAAVFGMADQGLDA